MISNAADGDGPDPDPTIPASYSLDSTGTCFAPDELGAHGLHVAGTIGAVGNDGIGVTGVNWSVRIRPVRALGVAGFGTLYDVAQAILYAAGFPAGDRGGGTVSASNRGELWLWRCDRWSRIHGVGLFDGLARVRLFRGHVDGDAACRGRGRSGLIPDAVADGGRVAVPAHELRHRPPESVRRRARQCVQQLD